MEGNLSGGAGDRARPTGGTGAILGAQVVRFSSLHSAGLVTGTLLGFAGTIVVAYLLGPADLGRFALLLFLAMLLNLLFNLGSKQGTMRRTYGADEEEDEGDEEREEVAAEATDRTLGTGLVLTALVAATGAALVLALSRPISELLLGTPEEGRLVVWAALAGGFGAIFRLAAAALWLERRAVAYVVLGTVRPLLVLAALTVLVAAGAGIEGAIAGTAIGSAAGMLIALLLLRDSYTLTFDPGEAAAIIRGGVGRIPIIASFWVVSFADIFILSRFVSDADLGIYQLAARFGLVASLLPAGFRKAIRPLQRTTTFAAVEDEYGVGVARGTQLNYFLLMVIGVLLAVALLAQALVKIAPASFADAAPLIPLLAAGLIGPTLFRIVNKVVKFERKASLFTFLTVAAAVLFLGGALALVPLLGLAGAPLAMIACFGLPVAYLLYRSQRGRLPLRIEWGSLALASALAGACALAYYAIDPPGVVLQSVLSVGLIGTWGFLLVLTGAVPSRHRRPLVHMGRAAIGRAPAGFDPERALEALSPADREALRMAIVERRPLSEIATVLGGDGPSAGEQLVRALRRAASGGGLPPADAGERDAEIGAYLFEPGPVARRDAAARRLLRGKAVTAGELRELEAVTVDLERSLRRA
jgi:O-antigen/teichoic acid export membrane protein